MDTIRARIPLARLGQPEEVARVVHFLAADASSYITGQVWGVNGGMEMAGFRMVSTGFAMAMTPARSERVIGSPVGNNLGRSLRSANIGRLSNRRARSRFATEISL